MRKKYLLKYEPPLLHILADYMVYYLYIETVWFWGLFKTQEKTSFKIYEHQNFKSHFDHWDNLIKNKTEL